MEYSTKRINKYLPGCSILISTQLARSDAHKIRAEPVRYKSKYAQFRGIAITATVKAELEPRAPTTRIPNVKYKQHLFRVPYPNFKNDTLLLLRLRCLSVCQQAIPHEP